MKQLLTLFCTLVFSLTVTSQSFNLKKEDIADSSALEISMGKLAQNYLSYIIFEGIDIESIEQFRFQILAGQYEESIKTIDSFRGDDAHKDEHPVFIQYELYARAKMNQKVTGNSFEKSYREVFRNYLKNCDDTKASNIVISFTTYDAVAQFTSEFKDKYTNTPDGPIDSDMAAALLKSYFLYNIYFVTEPIIYDEAERDENNRYSINEELIVSPIDGAELSVLYVMKRDYDLKNPQPAILIFTIYADNSNKNQAMIAASKGYVGVIANSRGKRKSNNQIEPYIHEHKDVYAVIDWVSKQSWNNGKVGMYGGSYNGFSQWASMKEKVHPALKTIVPSVSAAPGIDVPMENNVFHNFPYKWIPFVTKNKFLDNSANFDRNRWNNLQSSWFNSGAAYNKMDSIDGYPNRLFQEWISHPTYDRYWQAMIPYKNEFAHIDIPVLTTTGYYDDGQRGAMYYYNEHLKYNPDANHYLLIGPYDHWGAQGTSVPNLRGYEIDSAATINIREGLVFEWFDYILKGKEKPTLLKDKVNFQVMGENKWLHKPSLSAMSSDSLVYYFGEYSTQGNYSLVEEKSKENNPIKLIINLDDRTTSINPDYYPWPIIKDSINLQDGLVFKTGPFESEVIINGSFTGDLFITSNKKDFDYSVNLYELTPEGKYFHLSYIIGRASHANGKEIRNLITPHTETNIPFDNTRIICKKISKGSQLIAIVNGNKNPYSQINYGTGKDVSSETIQDAKTPLELSFSSKSRISVPVYLDK